MATEPEQYEKIVQLQELQKNIVQQNDLLKEKQIEIDKKEAELFEYRNVIQRYQVQGKEEDLQELQLQIKERTQSIEQIQFELDKTKDEIGQLNFEIEVLQKKI